MSVRARKPAAGQPSFPQEATSAPTTSSQPPLTSAAAPADDTLTRKEPPPEKASDVRRRSYVILSFWVIAVMLGLPIWWHTTSIYRASLPLDEMLDWSDGKLCRPVFPLDIAIEAPSLPQAQANDVLSAIRSSLSDQNILGDHRLALRVSDTADKPENSAALILRLTQSESATSTSAALHPHLPILEVSYPGSSVSSQAALESFSTEIAKELQSTFAEEAAIISYLLSNSAGSDQEAPAQSSEVQESIAKRTTRSMRYAPAYHLTFSLFTDGPSPSRWDIQGAVEEYMQPILDLLSPIHNFTIDTQVQLYAAPGVQSNLLTKEDLSSFINAAEWPLSPSIGGAPTVNFVVYVGNQTIGIPQADQPSAESTVFDTSQSWLIPQWGTVYLLAQAPSQTHLDHTALKQPMLTFTSNLLSLLGTPQSGNLPLRLSTLTRIRSADVLIRASSTLGSLARISRALPNIAIPGSVADGVASAMQHLRLACGSLGGAEGLAHARVAEAEAERAFFEKSMVGQLYFPDEHKIAVYLPLLGPVGVPLIIGMINELKAWRKRRREAKEAEKKSQ